MYVSSAPFMPLALSFDIGGNPLPLRGNPSEAALPANPWTAAATSAPAIVPVASPRSSVGTPASVPGGVPVVLPWVDYGGGAAGGTVLGDSDYRESPNEPPWSDSLVGDGGCGCGRSLSIWERIKAHPWITLGIVATVVALMDR